MPLFGDYTVACGPDAQSSWSDHAATEIPVSRSQGRPLRRQLTSPVSLMAIPWTAEMIRFAMAIHFSSNGLQEAQREITSIKLCSSKRLAGRVRRDFLRFRRDGGGYQLESRIRGSTDRGTTGDAPSGPLVSKLDQQEINPLATHIGESFKRQDIPPLYGLEYNRGNWGSGHVSVPGRAILFVTLQKDAVMTQYADHFEGPEAFVWSSQNSTSPEGKKGREILKALETGTSIELWARAARPTLPSYISGGSCR